MHMRTRSVTAQFDAVIKKLLGSKQKVKLNSVNNSSETICINDLIKRNSEAGKATIFTFTSGPFKTTGELPQDWMKTLAVIGCSTQLSVFEKKFAALNAVVIGLNKQSNDYQCGEDGLLAVKVLNSLNMISDEDNKLEKELGLSAFTVNVNGKAYFKHFSIVVRPDNVAKGFMLQSPVTDPIMNDHINDINGFMALDLRQAKRVRFA
jgi:hypothetical protein